jgi:type VI secretion system secreted protein Hcp
MIGARIRLSGVPDLITLSEVKIMKNIKTLIISGLFALVCVPGLALAAGYIKIDGVDGESALAPVRGENIEILSWSWGMSQSGARSVIGDTQDIVILVPARAGRAAPATPTHGGQFRITKDVDKTTPKLLETLSRGEVVPEITLTESQDGGDSMTVRLQNARMVAVEMGSGQETLTLNFESISVTYTPQRGQAETASFTTSGAVEATAPAVRSR